jgi:hypothetical protein
MQKESSLEMRDEDAKDLPIELRRLDDDYNSVGLKSRSLGSILLYPPQKKIVRSLSSVPILSLGGSGSGVRYATETSRGEYSLKEDTSKEGTKTHCRPKLMKQKQSISDDSNEDFLLRQHLNYCDDIKSQFLRKQNSLNEELMAESRIREKERIRKKIQKQVSLNETFLYRSLLTKRLQVIREGFTTKFKKSTGSIERLTKNGFVKIIKNMKTVNSPSNIGSDFPINSNSDKITKYSKELGSEKSFKCNLKREDSFKNKVRRPSESDSSSKDSRSDTSFESEDSFASVIHNPTLIPTSPLALPVQSSTSQNLQKDSFTFEDVDKKINEKLIRKTPVSTANQVPPLKLSNVVKDLAEIPKFKRKLTNFPIVKRLSSSTSLGCNERGKHPIVSYKFNFECKMRI